MKAWLLDRLGGTLKLDDVPIPEPRPGGVIVKIEASALMSYLKAYVEGRLPIYSPPEGWFTPGGNAIGIVHEVGPEVYHLKPGQRVVVSSHVIADENVPEPAQFLLGITAGPAGKSLQADWRDGTLAEYALSAEGVGDGDRRIGRDRPRAARRAPPVRRSLWRPHPRAPRRRRNHHCDRRDRGLRKRRRSSSWATSTGSSLNSSAGSASSASRWR